jgi:iron complex transport system substrate-binding protein
MRTVQHKALALVASATLACGAVIGAGASPASSSSPFAPRLTFPMSITTPAGTIQLKSAPRRIISLSPTATEILYAIGAGKRVIAVDDYSDFPKRGLPKTRFNAYEPNIEQIIAMHPTLVVVSYNANNMEADLAAAGIPVMEQDAAVTLDGTYMQETWLGDATGHYSEALEIAKYDRARIARDVARVPRHRSFSIYYELDPTLFSLTSQTYAGSLLEQLGVKNIADASGTIANGGYPQLSDEYVISANPGAIFLADTVCCKQSYDSVRNRAGWRIITAVKHRLVFKLNDDIASRWGPRVSILMDDLTTDVLHAIKVLKK